MSEDTGGTLMFDMGMDPSGIETALNNIQEIGQRTLELLTQMSQAMAGGLRDVNDQLGLMVEGLLGTQEAGDPVATLMGQLADESARMAASADDLFAALTRTADAADAAASPLTILDDLAQRLTFNLDGDTRGAMSLAEAMRTLDEGAGPAGELLKAVADEAGLLDTTVALIGPHFNDWNRAIGDLVARLPDVDSLLAAGVQEFELTREGVAGATDAVRIYNQTLASAQQAYDRLLIDGEALTNVNLVLQQAIDASTAAEQRQGQTADAEVGILDRLRAMIAGVVASFGELAAGVDLGAAGLGRFRGGVGELIAIMAGFTVFGLAGHWVKTFFDSVIQGNSNLETFRNAIANFVGPDQAGQIVTWSQQVGLNMPFLTSGIQRAIQSLIAMGFTGTAAGQPLNTMLMDVGKLAAAMGIDLPTAIQAVHGAFEGRWTMMQQRLNITREQLVAFGLDNTDINTRQATMEQALTNYIAAHGDMIDALTTKIHTYAGAITVVQDRIQLLGLAFGKPIFDAFKNAVAQIIVAFATSDWTGLLNQAAAAGDVFAGAVTFLTDALESAASYAAQHRAVLMALAAVLGGMFLSVLLEVGVAVAGMVAPFLALTAPFALLAMLAMLLARHFKDLYDHSEAFRAQVAMLGVELGRVWNNVKPLVELIGRDLLGVLDAVAGAIASFVAGHLPQINAGLDHLAGFIDKVKLTLEGAPGGFAPLHVVLAAMLPLLAGIIPLFAGAAGALGPLGDAFGKVAGFGVKAFGPGIGDFLGKIGPALAGIPGGIDRAFVGFFDLIDRIPPVFQIIDKAFVGFFDWLDSLPAFAEMVRPLAEALSHGLGGALTLLTDAMGNGLSWGAILLGMLQDFIPVALAAAAPFLAIALAVGSVVFAFVHFFQTSAGFRAMLGEIGRQVMGLLKPAFDSLHQVGTQLAQTWKTQLEPAVAQLMQAFRNAQPLFLLIGGVILGVLVVAIGILIAAFRGILSALGPVLSGVIRIVGGLVQIITGAFGLILNIVGMVMAVVGDIIHGRWDKIGQDVAHFAGAIWTNIKTIFGGIVATVTGLLGGLWGGVSAALGGFFSGIIGFFTNIWDKLVGHSIIPDMIMGIVGWFAKLPGLAMAHVADLAGQLAGTLGGLGARALQWGTDMVQGFINGIKNLVGNVASAVGNVAQGIKHVLGFSIPAEGPLHDADTYMEHFGDLLVSGLGAQRGRVQSAAAGVAAAAAGGLAGRAGGAIGSTGALAAGGAGAGALVAGAGGGGNQTVTVNLNLHGGLGAGLQMLNATDRAAFAHQIAVEMGQAVRLQTIMPAGYAGATGS